MDFNAVCLPFFVGRKPIKVNFEVSNPAHTTAGTNAFAPGRIE